VLGFFFFSWFALSAHFPIQYVSGDGQTHFGAAHYRLWVLWCTIWACKWYIILLCITLQAWNVHNRTQSL
jgi:hypothetical protein